MCYNRELYCEWIMQANADKQKLYRLLPTHQHSPPTSVKQLLHCLCVCVCVYLTQLILDITQQRHKFRPVVEFYLMLSNRSTSPQKHLDFLIVLHFIEDEFDHQTFRMQPHDPLGLSISVIHW